MTINYSEQDILFYGRKEVDYDIDTNQFGYLISWKANKDTGGYMISRRRSSQEGWEVVVTVDSHVDKFQDNKPEAKDVMYHYKVEEIIEGDFMLNPLEGTTSNDFALTEDHQSAEQDIINRIRTQKEDWRSHPNLGANLEDLEGEPNTRKVGEQGVEQIFETLTYDNRFSAEDIKVKAVPVSINQIDYYTIVDSDDDSPLVIRNPLTL